MITRIYRHHDILALACTMRLVNPAMAAHILAHSGVVVLPTETVYGLAAAIDKPDAIAKIFAIKGRPLNNPLIVHVGSVSQAWSMLADLPSSQAQRIRTVMDQVWPGPITLVVPVRHNCVPSLARSALDTVALRYPAHPIAQDVIHTLNTPIVMPSANRSGYLSPTTVAGVEQALGKDIARDMPCVDGGSCSVGLESTVIDMTTSQPRILRQGTTFPQWLNTDGLNTNGLNTDGLSTNAPNHPVTKGNDYNDDIHAHHNDGTHHHTKALIIKSPGMLLKHYAPQRLLVINCNQWPDQHTSSEHQYARLGFGDNAMAMKADLNLSPTGDLIEAARHLYEYMRRLDSDPYDAIAVQSIAYPLQREAQYIWYALMDRLERGCAGSNPER